MKDYMATNDYFSSIISANSVPNNPDKGGQYLQQPAPTPAPIPMTPETAVIMGVVDITKETIHCFTEYAKCREHEKTERKRITATLRAIQYQIDAQKEEYLKELENQYEERKRLYDLAEKTQEKALELGDKEMLQLCYNLILNVYNKPVGVNGATTSLVSNSYNSIDTFR